MSNEWSKNDDQSEVGTDDAEEWNTEAAKMADIYRGSILTLAAVSSKDSKEGYFRFILTEKVSSITRVAKDGSTYSVYCRQLDPKAFDWLNFNLFEQREGTVTDSIILLTRAWCHQECVLAPRLLLCNDWALIWYYNSAFWYPGHRPTSQTSTSSLVAKAHRPVSDLAWKLALWSRIGCNSLQHILTGT
ncbi:hypothetical protein BDZ45DRAFT_801682 [Acephala macrosclerotiorum]|nr:hypothetical protein BDZ45DRAFT_801682 [Acephala macrosclerotiorum]